MIMKSVNSDSCDLKEKEKRWPQIVAILIASLCAITNGLIFSWTSPFIPKLVEDKQNYDITEYEASNLAIFQPAATLLSCSLFSYLSDLIGRKKTIMLIALPHLCYWTMTATASTIQVFYAAKVLAGMGDAGLFSALPMYIGEIAPEVRGTWGNCMVSAMYLGEFLVNVIGGWCNVKVTAYICLPLPVIFCVAFSFMPESPYFCVMKGRHEEAKRSLGFFKGKRDVEEDFQRLKADVERQMSERGTWLDMVRIGSNRRALKTAVFLRVSQQLGGLAVFYMYTQLIFQKSGSDLSPQASSMLFMGLCFMLNVLMVTFLTSRISRKTSYIISLSPCALVLYVLAAYFYVDEYLGDVDVAFLSWLPITGMVLYQIFCSFGIAIIPTLMLGELFSASIKSKAMTLLLITFSVSTFVTNFIFNTLLARFGIFAPFLFFAVCNTASTVLSFYLIPETKGKTLEEIQQMLKNKGAVKLMKRNHITDISVNAFANLTSLKVLELDDNFLTHIPSAITKLPDLQEFSISGNRIKYIEGGLLQKTPALTLLELKGNPLVGVDSQAFSFLPRLRKLILSDARELSTFPNLNGTSALEILRLDRDGITSVPSSLCTTCPRLKSLDLKSNKLRAVPDLNYCREMRVLDLASNHVRSIEDKPFRGMYQMHDLLLAHNQIQYIPQDAFYNLSKLQVLDLEDNQISFIHPDAFMPISKIEDLNLGNNVFPHLPTAGLELLLHLKTFNNPNLREFPPPTDFPRIQTLVLAYAYHCCAFLPLIPSNPPPAKAKDIIVFPDIEDIDLNFWNSSVDLWPSQQNISQKFGKKFGEIWENIRSDFTYPSNFPSYMEEYAAEEDPALLRLPADADAAATPSKIQCLPLPGPFLPCQDLFDWWTLRCGVWIVFLCAMLGNGTVVFVLIFSRSKMDVPRFLVCNLAAADFFMGIYLGFLAVVDASTLGEFRMYAIPWQMSSGCQLSGFLGVLSSELSVWTLAVITLERNYAITHAMHLNKRLSLKHAGYIMVCGWGFAAVMAVMPIFNISDYRKFAVCLPFETGDSASLAYVVFLMFINGVAFLILMGCYLKMYCAIRGSQAWNSNDSRIAKRMALLVFTDFLCWSPIAFFALTAAFGLQLISLEQAKVFTVFVLPLNSCCNPFLYAILTKQFKKDCVMICKAIEESRVTRGIGRCRHSSNFSNRQTPANTNSLADRSSREKQDNHTPQCTCNAKLLGEQQAQLQKQQQKAAKNGAASGGGGGDRKARAATTRQWLLSKARWLLCVRRPTRHRPRSDQYTYQIAEIQQKQHKRASSVSSSENFSSSRSDSWRHNHHCGIPLRLLDPKRRASSWLVTRKTSQDSNLSSSRNDSSGSATTASTGTWRASRSSASSSEPTAMASTRVAAVVGGRAKPRLTRQTAVQDEGEPPGSPGRLTVRFLTTIPSAAETSVQLEDDAAPPSPPAAAPAILVSPARERDGPLYAILHATTSPPPPLPPPPLRRQSVVTLHPAGSGVGGGQAADAGPVR